MNAKRQNPATAIISVIVYVLITNIINFASAARGGGTGLFGIVVSLAFVALWCWQLSQCAKGSGRIFIFFTTGYWLLSLIFYWMTFFSFTYHLSFLAYLGFIGMIMLYIPLYPLVSVAMYFLRVDYYIGFTLSFLVCFGVLITVFFFSKKKYKLSKQQGDLSEDLENSN